MLAHPQYLRLARISVSRRCLHRAVLLICATAAIVAVAAAPASADEEPLPNKFMLRLGGYAIQDSNTIVRLDSANAPGGAFVDFGETLGGDTRTTMVRLDSLYRFNDHHALSFAWYDVKFKGSKALSRDIEWGGITYPANTQVDSELEFDMYKLNYQYSVFRNEEAELGVSFGFHIMRISTSVNASGVRNSKNEATAPLPVWGLFANYNFTPRFSAYYNYQSFFVSYEDKVKGRLQDFLLGLEYRLFRNIALGAAYNWFSMNLEIEKDVTTLKLDSSWHGGMLYAAVYF